MVQQQLTTWPGANELGKNQMANADVEDRAIALVIAYEMRRLNLRTSASIRRVPRGEGYDLESADGRKIEVKGTEGESVNMGFRFNTREEIQFAESGGFVYRVIDVFGSPRLYIFRGNDLNLYRSEWASVSAPKRILGAPVDLPDGGAGSADTGQP